MAANPWGLAGCRPTPAVSGASSKAGFASSLARASDGDPPRTLSPPLCNRPLKACGLAHSPGRVVLAEGLEVSLANNLDLEEPLARTIQFGQDDTLILAEENLAIGDPSTMERPSSVARRWAWAFRRSQSEYRGSSWK